MAAIGMDSRGDCDCRGPAVSNPSRLSGTQLGTKDGNNDLLLTNLSFRISVNRPPSALYNPDLSHIRLNVRGPSHTYEDLLDRKRPTAAVLCLDYPLDLRSFQSYRMAQHAIEVSYPFHNLVPNDP